MNILFADKFPEAAVDQLIAQQHECLLSPELGGDSLAAALADVEVLVVRSTQVTAEMMVSAERLRLIVRAGSGTNTIDTLAAVKRDIAVCNVPGRNAAAVAELAMGLLISIDRKIPDNVFSLRAGRWNKKFFSTSKGLVGRRMGIFGLGATGLAMAQRAIGFDIEVYAIDRPDRFEEKRRQVEKLGVKLVADQDSLIDVCDILSFHVPATDQTRNMVNAKFLAKLSPGTIIINTSRGDLIDEPALIEVMDKKDILVGLDVYRDEPGTAQGEFDSALARHPNVYGTHHIGASTTQAQIAVAAGVIEVIDAFTSGHMINCVNPSIGQ